MLATFYLCCSSGVVGNLHLLNESVDNVNIDIHPHIEIPAMQMYLHNWEFILLLLDDCF